MKAVHTWPLHLLKDVATLLIEYTVDASQSVLRGLDLHKVDGLCHPGLSCQLGSIDGSPAGWDDLSTSSMDSVCVQNHITYLQHTCYTQLGVRMLDREVSANYRKAADSQCWQVNEVHGRHVKARL